MNLSFYTPISYDFNFSFASILSYYNIAEEIILGIDEDNISWSNNKFEFNKEFFLERIKKIDSLNKIKIISFKFHGDTCKKNEDFEREFLVKKCKKENYILGIDSDEIILNPIEFKEWFYKEKPIKNILGSFSTVFKRFDTSLLLTTPSETQNIGAFNIEENKLARFYNKNLIFSPVKILHFSWGRNREQLLKKLNNFGHSKDFNLENYIVNIWDKVNLENFKSFSYFHPLKLKIWWKSLSLLDLNNFDLDKNVLNEILNF